MDRDVIPGLVPGICKRRDSNEAWQMRGTSPSMTMSAEPALISP